MSARTLAKIKKQEKELQKHQNAFKAQKEEFEKHKVSLVTYQSELESQREDLNKQGEQIKKDLEEHKKFEFNINKALAEVHNVVGVLNLKTLSSCPSEDCGNILKGSLEDLVMSIRYFINIEDKKGISNTLMWLVYPFILVNRSAKLADEDIIIQIKNIFNNYPKENQYIKNNLNELFSLQKEEYGRYGLEKIKKIFSE